MASGELRGKLPGRLPEAFNERLLEAIDLSGIGLALTDAQDRFIYVNDAHARIYGRSREEILGKTWRDLTPQEIVAAQEKAVWGYLARGEVFSCETLGFRGDGTLGYHQVMAVPLADEGGGYAGHVCIVQDITERKRAEEALEKRTHDVRERVKELNCLFAVSELDMKGVSLEELLQETVDLIPAAWQYPEIACARVTLHGQMFSTANFKETPWRQASDIVARGDLAGSLEVYYLEERPESDEGPFLKEARSLLNTIAERLGKIAERKRAEEELDRHRLHLEELVEERTAELKAINAQLRQEIAERKRAEESLRESEHKYRHLFENLNDAAFVADAETGIILDTNKRAEMLLGRSRGEIVGMHQSELHPPGEAEKHRRIFAEHVAKGYVADIDAQVVGQSGAAVPVSISTAATSIGGTHVILGLFRDITERKQAEEALKESEERFRSLVETTSDWVWEVDENAVYTYASPKIRDILGYEPEEVLGRTPFDLMPPEEARRVAEVFGPIAASPRPFTSLENKNLHRDGHLVVLETSGVPFFDAHGTFRGWRGIDRDITERKQAEEALQRSERELRVIAENVPALFSYVDKAGRYRFVNRGYQEWFGRPEADIVGRHYREVLGEATYELIKDRVEAALSGQHVSYELALPYTAVGMRWVIANYVPDIDERGRVRGFFALVTDITERKQAEEEIERARRRIEELARREKQRANWLATILDQLPIGVCIAAAPDVKVVLFNKKATEIAGMPVQPGHSWSEHCRHWRFQYPDGRPLPAEEVALARAVLRGEHVVGAEHVVERPDGTRLNLRGNAIPLLENGQVVGGVVAFWDVTAEREVQRGLEEASRLKDEFLSMASHELKTPVTSIKIFAELAARRPEAVQPELMKTLLRQADQLVSLVNDLLDVSRLELGRMPAEMKVLDLVRLLGEFCERNRPLFGQRLVCRLQDEAVLVQGDAMRLEQVFSNLLDNALKYSPDGGRVWLRVSRRNGKARVEVEDRGIGIAPEALPHIFERFYKPGPQQSVYSGLGVGLYISKEIVERHGGRLWAESEPGKGSTFYLELPLVQNEV